MIPTIILTKSGGVLGPIADIMGFIMDGIFRLTSSMGIVNIGLCIILFTLVTRILMYPLSYNQSKSQKLMAVVQPEIQAIQAKYKGREGDQQAMMMQNAEIKAVYEKYGTSMTGGCLPLLIQMPIIFALYRVILNIPAYVSSVRVYFENIVTAIGGESAVAKVNEFAKSTEELTKLVQRARISGGEITTTDNIIDFLYNLNPAQWESFKQVFSGSSAVIEENYAVIEKMNNFLGLNIAAAPSSYGWFSPKAWIIPILAGLSQYAVTKLTSAQTKGMTDDSNPMSGTMNQMMIMMPLMSVFFCFSFATGIGIYWVASSVFMGIQQYFLNKKMAKIDTQELIRANIAKQNAKRAKKGLPPINEKATEDNLKRMQAKREREEQKLQQKAGESQARRDEANAYYKTGSIAERARMVEQYNEKNSKK